MLRAPAPGWPRHSVGPSTAAGTPATCGENASVSTLSIQQQSETPAMKWCGRTTAPALARCARAASPRQACAPGASTVSVTAVSLCANTHTHTRLPLSEGYCGGGHGGGCVRVPAHNYTGGTAQRGRCGASMWRTAKGSGRTAQRGGEGRRQGS